MNRELPTLTFDQGTLLPNEFSARAVERVFPSAPWLLDARVGKYRADALWLAEVQRSLGSVAGRVSSDVPRWQ
ncbi:MAG: hypothetical protein KF752_02300 [Pirellulaceae bacterium]|nr:hypothetical protein [Pirellulaceae bacterium]